MGVTVKGSMRISRRRGRPRGKVRSKLEILAESVADPDMSDVARRHPAP